MGLRADAEAERPLIDPQSDPAGDPRASAGLPELTRRGCGGQPADPPRRPRCPTRSAVAGARARQPMRPGRASCSGARARVIGSPQPRPRRALPPETKSSARRLPRRHRLLPSAPRVPRAGPCCDRALPAGAAEPRGARWPRAAPQSSPGPGHEAGVRAAQYPAGAAAADGGGVSVGPVLSAPR